MKKLSIILLLISISFCIYSPNYGVFAKPQYARIEKPTNIYRSSTISNTFENIYCIGEESYFVEIIQEINDMYKVNYNNITGFVKKEDVKGITNSPSTPYPYNIKLNIGSNCNLRSTPTTATNTNNIISTIYANTTDIIFIGRASGEEAIDFGGKTWYYVCYQNNYGYIYNNYVSSITPIYPSKENFTYYTAEPTNIINPITHAPSIIIIIILTLPLLGTLLLLYLPKKVKLSTSKKTKKHIKSKENY